MNQRFPYSSQYIPPAPVLEFRLAAPGEKPNLAPLTAIVDTGSDATLIPGQYLEAIEAIAVGDAMLHGILGEAQTVNLYEIDIHLENIVLPSMIVVGIETGNEIILGRNILNRLILLLDGQHGTTELLEHKPGIRR